MENLSLDHEFKDGSLRIRLLENHSQGPILIDSVDISLVDLKKEMDRAERRTHVSRSRDLGESPD